eukprot:jgi/Astpho2/4322/fgenesh1_pg.00065_%23_12_t
MATLSCLALLIASLPGCCSVAWPAGKASSLSPPLQSNVFQFLGGGIRPPLRPASPVQSEFVAAHQELQGRLQHHDASIPLAGHPLRGIIMPAGGSLRLGSAMVVLHVLRRGLGCHLPVEIWHTQDEMDDATRNFLERNFGRVRCVDATEVPYPAHHRRAPLKGWALKAFALHATKFTDVLLLDSDCLPVRNPDLLFDSPEYATYGSMLWPDVFAQGLEVVSGIEPQLWHLLGLEAPWQHHVRPSSETKYFLYAESGQVLLNRKRHANVIELLWFLNSWGIELVYDLSYGDKDTFSLAFSLAGKPEQYYQVPEFNRIAVSDMQGKLKLEHTGIFHHAPSGQVAFFHRTAGGKTNMIYGELLRADHVSMPLDPQTAFDFYTDAGDPDNYRFPRGSIDAQALADCTVLDGDHELSYRALCPGARRSGLPVPVMAQTALQGTQLHTLLTMSYTAFLEYQERFQDTDQAILARLPWV